MTQQDNSTFSHKESDPKSQTGLTFQEEQTLRDLAAKYPELAAWLRGRHRSILQAAELDNQPATWADIKTQIGDITWLWDKWIANGFLNILAGESGAGKSTLLLRLCQPILKPGITFPDGTRYQGEPGRVLWVECEAAEALNIRRAESWGIPLDALLTPFSNPFIQVNLEDANHQAAVTAAAQRDDIRMIVIDSLRGSHRGDENSSELVNLVLYLAALARDTNKPVIATHHLRKKSAFDGELTQDRLRGSSAIVQPARLIMGLDTPDPEQPDNKRLSVLKSNLAAKPKPIGVTINETGIIFGDAPEAPRAESANDKAIKLLLDLLGNDQERPTNEIYSLIEGAGISRATIARARKQLNVESFRRNDIWYCRLPNKRGANGTNN